MVRWLGKLTTVEFVLACIFLAAASLLAWSLLEACAVSLTLGGAGI